MDVRAVYNCLMSILLLLTHFDLFSGLCIKNKQTSSKQYCYKKLLDITTPITTIPIITTSTPPATPMTTAHPAAPVSPSGNGSGGASSSWCIASQGADRRALQLGLDYACGTGGANCSQIQPSGRCYIPNTVRDHASYAYNDYYQKNPLPYSCNFGGTAVLTSTDPSTETCRYPSTSTSSTVLNTTSYRGSTVFGAVPSSPTPSSKATNCCNKSTQVFILSFVVNIFMRPQKFS